MTRRRGQHLGQFMNLDSLVDIVSNNVGIVVILAAFMALFALLNPLDDSQAVVLPSERPPQRLQVPWSHPTSKNHLLFAVRGNRIQFFDLRPVFRELAEQESGGAAAPVTLEQPGLRVRFFPVTNQVYCMEFTPADDAGEGPLQAERPDSKWQDVLRTFPPERYVYFFWVAGDSFAFFRGLRQTLWERQIEVGWRPTRAGQPLEVCNGFEGSTGFQPQ